MRTEPWLIADEYVAINALMHGGYRVQTMLVSEDSSKDWRDVDWCCSGVLSYSDNDDEILVQAGRIWRIRPG